MTTISSPPPATLSTRRRWTVLAVCAAAMFLIGLDTTIVNVALPRIGSGLRTGTRGLQWVIDAYTIVFASLLITSGALADRFGRRRVFQIGLVTFGIASVLCAAASSPELLIAARALQGIGASMLGPVALGIVVNAMTDPGERAKAIGIWAAVFGLSMAAGPTVGGALLEVLDWRAVFWINAPVVATAVVLVALVVPESRSPHPRPLDLPGQFLLIVLIGLAVGTLIEAPRLGWAEVGALCLLLVVTAVVFVRVESRRSAPLIDPALFRTPAFTGSVLGAVVVFVALSTTLLLTTFSLQNARGWSPFEAGAAVLPLAVGATVFAPLSGILVARTGARMPLLFAGVLLGAGGACLFFLSENTGLAGLLLAYLLVGSGVGFANAPLTNIAVSSLPPERAGVAGGTTSTARQVGVSMGIAVAGGLIADVAPAGLAAAARPGWMIVALCGVALIGVATVVTRRR
ncbi:MFS transporter [Amycolatopsis umgeniensis]|uniref:EmrB/QacA subfamily drug resistance transporter n=1 Tax=Amycolatopsis umgeniensis TaxID=336628 RepID=A0A841BAX0_9PSEU|nr:MFS transporter [Amycolatopsis umgeniensis]MBB5855722.1 EmrB/QacA subfamily drug resistance transporter [Amycolatopsis umgeniensis]